MKCLVILIYKCLPGKVSPVIPTCNLKCKNQAIWSHKETVALISSSCLGTPCSCLALGKNDSKSNSCKSLSLLRLTIWYPNLGDPAGVLWIAITHRYEPGIINIGLAQIWFDDGADGSDFVIFIKQQQQQQKIPHRAGSDLKIPWAFFNYYYFFLNFSSIGTLIKEIFWYICKRNSTKVICYMA